MKNKFFKSKSFYAVFLSVVLSVVLVAGAAGAATTISTNINTGGTLTVSGESIFNGTMNLGDTTADLVYIHGAPRVIGAQGFVFGSSTAASLSAQKAGAVYFDSTNRVLRLYDGVNWYPVASSTDAAGSLIIGADNNLVRFNIVETAYMALGTTTTQLFGTSGPAVLTVQATSSAETAFRIYATSTQSADIFQILNSSAAELFVVDGLGNASSTASLSLGWGDNTSLAILSLGGMATTTASSGNIAGEGTLTIGGHVSFGATASTTASLTVGANRVSNGFLYVGGTATTTGSNGNFATEGNASSTSLNVGSGGQTTINGIVSGYCQFSDMGGAGDTATTIAASSTAYTNCTGAPGVEEGDRVFVNATASLNSNVWIRAASSSADAISIQLYNTGNSTGTLSLWNEKTGDESAPISVPYWVVR